MILAVLYSLLVVSLVRGTTLHFPEVFKGKCFEKNPNTNCTQLEERFSYAAKMDNANVTNADFAPFFEIADFSTPPSSILFWSGSMAFALAVSSNDARYTTVEETATGFVLNGLTWCGVPNAHPPQFDYSVNCVYPSNNTYYGMQPVWEQASELFAQGASGDISILLQPAPVTYGSSVYQAFRNQSIFGSVELPSMIPSKIKNIQVLVLRNSSVAPEEYCGSGSLLELDALIHKLFNFTASCVDDHEEIFNIFCPAGTQSGQCLAAALVSAQDVIEENNEHTQDYLIWAIVASGVAGIFIVVSLVLLVARFGGGAKKGE